MILTHRVADPAGRKAFNLPRSSMYHVDRSASRIHASALVRVALLAVCALAGVRSGVAQYAPPELPAEAAALDEPAIERKTPSFFRRPAEHTPAAQWQRVQRLEGEGRKRKAIKAANALVRKWHHSPEAAQAQLAIGRLQEARGDLTAAFDEYQYLIDHFAGLFPFQEVLTRQYQIANHLLKPPKTFLGLTLASLEDVRLRFEQIARNAPNWELAPDALFKAASCHELDNDPFAAADGFARLQTRYPAAPAAVAAAVEEIRIRRALAAKYPMDAALTRRAVAAIDNALRAYGDHVNRDEMAAWRRELYEAAMARAYERAAFYDGKRPQPRAALVAYREFLRTYPDAPQAEAVRLRIGELEAALSPVPETAESGVQP